MTKIKEFFYNFKNKFNAKCFLLEALLLIVVLSLDLITKHYVVDYLLTQPFNSAPCIDGFINLVYVKNYGASFGIFSGKTEFLIAFVIISLLIMAIIWIFFLRDQPSVIKISIIFLIAGGIGNLVDRIAFGYVRDFLNFSFFEFPVFNVADSFVVIGTFMLIIYLIYSLIVEFKKTKKDKDKEQTNE